MRWGKVYHLIEILLFDWGYEIGNVLSKAEYGIGLQAEIICELDIAGYIVKHT